ncbi:MAG: Hsp20 family protein [Gammaproteobacteria bacterium]|nr:Hsp20 family protein [Gammaproteobacteria bacterium]MDH3537094.1 Hsp20 family protein [Gammaproteobacteria bacterium]
MTTIDLSPLYRSSIGFDRMGSLLDSALRSQKDATGFPPYDIETTGDDRYAITLAVAGFEESDLDIQVEKGVLRVRGKKADDSEEKSYLYRGIANRSFERKFNLADFIEVSGAELKNGLLTISLVKEIPEAMKPRTIEIAPAGATLEHKKKAEKAA